MDGEWIVLLTACAISGGFAGFLLCAYGIWLLWLALFRPQEYGHLRRKTLNTGWLAAELRRCRRQNRRHYRPEITRAGR